MTDTEREQEYIKTVRALTFESDEFSRDGWVKEEYVRVPYHWSDGVKVYHSYADYSDD